jgi:hypothetical protein
MGLGGFAAEFCFFEFKGSFHPVYTLWQILSKIQSKVVQNSQKQLVQHRPKRFELFFFGPVWIEFSSWPKTMRTQCLSRACKEKEEGERREVVVVGCGNDKGRRRTALDYQGFGGLESWVWGV